MSKNDGPCKVKTCDHVGKRVLGFCKRHYHYFHEHGVPELPKRKPKRIPISHADAKWLAAVIDCEGWIGVRRRKSTVHGGWAYWASVGVGNTNRVLTDHLAALTGMGALSLVQTKPPHKMKHMWDLWAYDDVRDFLTTVRPHLMLKGQQADIILAMPAKDAKDPAARATAWDACHELNKKGRH